MPYYFFHPSDILILIGMVISFVASTILNGTFSKYSNIKSASNMTGAETARRILDSNGLSNVRVIPIRGNLTDHYNPANKTIALSENVINSTSLSAVSVAAHECGHAVQDLQDYKPYLLRSSFVPVVNFGQRLSIPLLMIGYIISFLDFLIPIGLLLFSTTLMFQLITLPVEFNASMRAFKLLEQCNILSSNEVYGSKKVLGAAALTYVAGAISAFLSLLRLMMIYGRRRD